MSSLGENVANFNKLSKKLNRLLSIVLGALILFLSFLATSIDSSILGSSFLGLNALIWFIMLDLFAIYLLLSGLKPELKLVNLLVRHDLAKDNTINGLLIFFISLLPLANAVFLVETVVDKVLFSLISVPGLIIGYIVFKDISIINLK